MRSPILVHSLYSFRKPKKTQEQPLENNAIPNCDYDYVLMCFPDKSDDNADESGKVWDFRSFNNNMSCSF